MNIIYGSPKRIYNNEIKSEVRVITSIDQIQINRKNNEEFFYIPVTKLDTNFQQLNNVYVYFDLEMYSFYQKIRETINSYEDKPKGVFRFRRLVTDEYNELLLIGDLYVLSEMFGNPERVHVKCTNPKLKPYHVILTVDFGEGTMAHFEYTFNGCNERIELEWSGVKKIIEFSSEEIIPFSPNKDTYSPLLLSVSSILSTSHKLERKVVDRLKELRTYLDGEVQ